MSRMNRLPINIVMNFDKPIDRSRTRSLKWDKYKGSDILPFWVADMDFTSPQAVLDALHARVDHGVFGYTLAGEQCTHAVLDYLSREHGFEAQADWLIWTPGLVPAINLACHAFAQPGDGILTFTPVYHPFLLAPAYANQQLQAVPLILDEGKERWEIDFERLEATVTPRSRMLILSNPHNPVGRVFEKEELEKLGEFIVRHDLILCSDEIHCDLILNDKKHICAGTLAQEIVDRTLIMMSPSKTYNLAGLSCAFVVIPNGNLRNRFKSAIRGIITEVNCLAYAACEAAYRDGESWRKQLITYLESNRQVLYSTIEKDMPAIKLYPMDATYLAWLDVRQLQVSDTTLLFEKFGVGLSGGAIFQGQGFSRLNFGCPLAQLQEGLHRMKRALDSLTH
jgi:cysteine-S-conjugate beta-lyase